MDVYQADAAAIISVSAAVAATGDTPDPADGTVAVPAPHFPAAVDGTTHDVGRVDVDVEDAEMDVRQAAPPPQALRPTIKEIAVTDVKSVPKKMKTVLLGALINTISLC